MRRRAYFWIAVTSITLLVVGHMVEAIMPDKMRVHTDAVTGCQYLTVPGGITPRLASDGRHLCGVVR